MNIREQFENEFPGCTSYSRIEEVKRELRDLNMEIVDLRQKLAGLDEDGIFIHLKGEEQPHRCQVTSKGDYLFVNVPDREGLSKISFDQFEQKGFAWLFDPSRPLMSGRVLMKSLGRALRKLRQKRDGKRREIEQMEMNWDMMQLALTTGDVSYALLCGLSFDDVLLDSEPAGELRHNWMQEGF
ncbi:hypothetical protein N9D23_00560 [Rubripirellula sp.]|nr:hypothetical protein [Rubripirellula sp.]